MECKEYFECLLCQQNAIYGVIITVIIAFGFLNIYQLNRKVVDVDTFNRETKILRNEMKAHVHTSNGFIAYNNKENPEHLIIAKSYFETAKMNLNLINNPNHYLHKILDSILNKLKDV